ncbi:DNA-binding CsgD family transcriptional regulator [Arthrobacter stackebrandtii]|uniref:DNA-binding CsgD family transcriptional regulator n=1 Tax=Arthrobacter stackebrandtii TaxID=272161 RepID=A0ABS4YRN7_9MICC|nr:DNA-binding CsgD family transcriptional regulator [Arthrobacter stackebrandtii]
MGGEEGVDGADIVGRSRELGFLGSFLAGAAAGTAGTLVVSGDPGVGKTALVQRACDSPAFTGWVFTGACLPLSSTTVPFLALRQAFRTAPSFDGDARPTLPKAGEPPNDAPVAIDTWMDELCSRRPVALVVDDLQWADESTLDVLMYLIAGPAERPLAIIATLRDGGVSDIHPLQRWLADIRRMPRIGWLHLGPLDRLDTGTQLGHLLGTAPHQSLVQEVFEHTAGNAYLNRLVVAGLDSGARHLPTELPADLKGAVLRSWRTLSDDARQLTQLLSVGGRPLPSADISAVAALDGSHGAVLALLYEAADAGIIESSTEGTHWWFRHPLIAEVLQQGLDEGERTRWHALFASLGESTLDHQANPDFESLVALADHHFAAGHTDAAYNRALQASAAAGHAGGTAEMLRLLRRAVALRDQLPGAAESPEALWDRLRAAAEDTGAQEEELEAVEALLEETDSVQRPLDVAELLVRRALLRFSTGREFLARGEMQRAVRLAGTDPGSWQYAYALAELAHAGLWKDDPLAPENALLALAAATDSGNPRALSYALTANSMAALLAGRPEEARALAERAAGPAAEARDFWALLHATIWRANATEAWSSQAFADLMRDGRWLLASLGSPHAYLAKMAADEASSYLAIGRWKECGLALRVALGSDPGAMGDVAARLAAARLAAWQGRQGEAEAHLARAEELFSQKSEFNNLSFAAVRAEVLLAADRPGPAYAAAMAGIETEGQPPTMCEWLLPLAARALADLAQSARDDGESPAELLALLHRLLGNFPAAFQESGTATELYTAQTAAFDMLYRAEAGRARGSAGNAREWIQTADACQAATLRWEEAYSCWRAADSLLLHGHSLRPLAATVLRRGLALAEELQALPIVAHLHTLAAGARIAAPSRLDAPTAVPAQLPGLTRREREILGFVVAGHTYAEIARHLVISEKTVSSHISSLLRKTGASNRIDLSRLATRSAAGPGPGAAPEDGPAG